LFPNIFFEHFFVSYHSLFSFFLFFLLSYFTFLLSRRRFFVFFRFFRFLFQKFFSFFYFFNACVKEKKKEEKCLFKKNLENVRTFFPLVSTSFFLFLFSFSFFPTGFHWL